MAGPTNKSGTIATTETWDLDGSPYLITDDIDLSADVDVFVEAGVRIEVQKKDATITMGNSSKFYFGGTRELPIHVHGQIAVRDFWGGFVLNATDPVIEAHYTTFEHARRLFDYDAPATLILEDCIVRDCTYVIDFSTTNLVGHIQRSVFERNIYVLFGYVSIIKLSDWGMLELEQSLAHNHFRENYWAIYHQSGVANLSGIYNYFYRNKKGAIFTNGGLTGVITLENCWWGSDSGPEDADQNPNGTGELIARTYSPDGIEPDFTPWWTLGRYVPIPDDAREFASRILREGTPSGEETTSIALTDDELNRILDRAEKYVDSWLTDEIVEKRLLGYGSETDETRDRPLEENYVRTRYRPIIAISSVEKRTGATTWTALSENELSGYYSSETDKRRGLVHFAQSPIYELDSVRLSYTHGYYEAPEEIRDAVLKLAALSIFQTILKPGESDPFASRVAALEREIEVLRERFQREKRSPSYVVI